MDRCVARGKKAESDNLRITIERNQFPNEGYWWWDEENNCICVNDVREFYYIPADELTTPENVLKWIAHMEEKIWVTNDVLGELVRHMLDHIGFSPFTGKKI